MQLPELGFGCGAAVRQARPTAGLHLKERQRKEFFLKSDLCGGREAYCISLTKRTSSSSSGSSLITITGPGDDLLRRLAAGADGGSAVCFQVVDLTDCQRGYCDC